MLIALLVCLIPTTIGGLLSAIGIAGMDRMIQRNVIAMSGRAVEAAGDVDVLLLDKTGTITLGNRQAVEFIPVGGVTPQELAEAAQLPRWRMKPRKAADRGAGQGEIRPARPDDGRRAMRRPEGMHFIPVQRPNPHERRGFRRHLHPQRRTGYHDGVDPADRAGSCPPI